MIIKKQPNDLVIAYFRMVRILNVMDDLNAPAEEIKQMCDKMIDWINEKQMFFPLRIEKEQKEEKFYVEAQKSALSVYNITVETYIYNFVDTIDMTIDFYLSNDQKRKDMTAHIYILFSNLFIISGKRNYGDVTIGVIGIHKLFLYADVFKDVIECIEGKILPAVVRTHKGVLSTLFKKGSSTSGDMFDYISAWLFAKYHAQNKSLQNDDKWFLESYADNVEETNNFVFSFICQDQYGTSN